MMFYLLIISVTFLHGIQSQSSWPCNIDQCSWYHRQPNDQITDQSTVTASTDVFCHAKTAITYQPVYKSLPLNLTSLSISCGSENSTCYITGKVFAIYSNMKTLSVERCNMHFIDLSFTFDLENLSTLHFSNVIYTSLKPSEFSRYQYLKSLTVTQSKISNLPFLSDFNAQLQLLSISQNRIQSPEVIITGNQNLTLNDLFTLDISYNDIRAIPQEIYSFAPNLKHLYVQGNQIMDLSIPSNFTLNKLEKFDASGNPIQFIDFRAFTSLENLTSFRITGSNESFLPLNDVIALPNIEDIMISNFNLDNSIWDFLHTPSIIRLNVSFNSLDRVILNNVTLLEKMYLQHNNISVLSADTFANLPNLQVLNMSCNGLIHLPESLFTANYHLKILDFSRNEITTLKSGIFRLNPEILYLDFSYNRLSHSLPYNIFSKLAGLLYLFLQGNELQFLPRISNLKKLHFLDISHNLLNRLDPYDLCGLKSLEILKASNNRFVQLWNGLLSCCPKLLSADFNNNQLRILGSFHEHPKLIELKLENNSLIDFFSRSPFSGMKSLAFLFLDNNNFHTITPNMFPPSIEMISMMENNIRLILRGSLMNMPLLSNLYLMLSRKVINIPQSSVQIYKPGLARPTIHLDFTNLMCNCELGYLKVWDESRHQIKVLRDRFPEFAGLEYVTCSSPFFPGIRRFRNVPLSQFVCEYNETMCFDVLCDCCRSSDLNSCQCLFTCPKECQCFYGGSSFWKDYIHINCQSRNLTYIPDLIPSMATHIYLDGNNITTLSSKLFAHLTYAMELNLNNSNIELIEDGLFNNMGALEYLRLQVNKITTISSGTFGNLTSLIELDLSHNQITIIQSGAFDSLTYLKTLRLHYNKLTTILNVLDLPSVMSLTLSLNPWSCECHPIKTLLTYISTLEYVILDTDSMCCTFQSEIPNSVLLSLSNSSFKLPGRQEQGTLNFDKDGFVAENRREPPFERSHNGQKENSTHSMNNNLELIDDRQSSSNLIPGLSKNQAHNMSCFPVINFNFDLVCRQEQSTIAITGTVVSSPETPVIFIVLIIVTSTLLVLVFFVVIIIWRRRELQAFVYTKTGVRIWDKKADLDKPGASLTKVFDAFISYSQGDHEFVCNTLVPNLEKKNYHVCVHYRDFPVGGDIADVIKRAIYLSSRTILVVSKHFLRSNWCRFEFQTAHHYILTEGSQRLVLLLLEDIPEDELDPDFKVHMKSNTYLKAQDAWFWEKLYFTLPSISVRKEEDGGMVSMMRGMKILAGEDEQVEREIAGVGKEEHKNRNNDGGNEITKKIDWKKEEERIMNERKNRERFMNENNAHCVNEDRETVIGWISDNDVYYYMEKDFERGRNNTTIDENEKNNVDKSMSMKELANVNDIIDTMVERTMNQLQHVNGGCVEIDNERNDGNRYDTWTEMAKDSENTHFQWVANDSEIVKNDALCDDSEEEKNNTLIGLTVRGDVLYGMNEENNENVKGRLCNKIDEETHGIHTIKENEGQVDCVFESCNRFDESFKEEIEASDDDNNTALYQNECGGSDRRNETELIDIVTELGGRREINLDLINEVYEV